MVDGREVEGLETIPLSTIRARLHQEFPGITDKIEIKNWDPPFPYDNTRMNPRDERFWNEHRTTPKAYITLKTARPGLVIALSQIRKHESVFILGPFAAVRISRRDARLIWIVVVAPFSV